MRNNKDGKGFVYILTNPSFRENWAKIGRSRRPVDIRSRELDNTAISLPFEIYATIRTSKYIELEREFHKILTELADARIRKGREFFNITPQKAFEHLAGIAGLINDVEYYTPEEETGENNIKKDRKGRTNKGKYVVKSNEIFYLKRLLADGKMKVADGNKYVVLEGTKIDPNNYPGSGNSARLRKKYKEFIKNNIVISGIEFNSPSSAGEFVAGGSINGKYYWRTEGDKKIADFIEYIK